MNKNNGRRSTPSLRWKAASPSSSNSSSCDYNDARAKDKGSAREIDKVGPNHGSANDEISTSQPQQAIGLCRVCLTGGSPAQDRRTGVQAASQAH